MAMQSVCCKYYSPLSFNQQFKPDESALSKMSFISYKYQKRESNLDDFQCHILLNHQFLESKILGVPVSRHMRPLIYLASGDKVDVDAFHNEIQTDTVEIWL